MPDGGPEACERLEWAGAGGVGRRQYGTAVPLCQQKFGGACGPGRLLSSARGALFADTFLTAGAAAVLVSAQAEGVASARFATDLQWLSLCRELGRPMPPPVQPLTEGIAGGGGFDREVRSPTC